MTRKGPKPHPDAYWADASPGMGCSSDIGYPGEREVAGWVVDPPGERVVGSTAAGVSEGEEIGDRLRRSLGFKEISGKY